VSLFYGEKSVAEHITFTLSRGDRVSIAGKNGSGKSTLLRLLIGEDVSYSGAFYRPPQLKISYVQQDTSQLFGTLDEYAGSYGVDISLFKAILRKLGFSRAQFEKRVEDYSGGQKKKALIARSLCEQAHVYVWDEPLNFIDALSRIQIEDLILRYEPALIFVEHDSAFCKKVASRTISL
jgi:lincosamide and streptogramin A transport system ATP-binding/permease protein